MVDGICCGKQKPAMSPLRKQGSRAKKLDSRFRGNDKYCFRNRNYLARPVRAFVLRASNGARLLNQWEKVCQNHNH